MATEPITAATSEVSPALSSAQTWQGDDGRAVSWLSWENGNWFILTRGTKSTLTLRGVKLESNPAEHGSPPPPSAVR